MPVVFVTMFVACPTAGPLVIMIVLLFVVARLPVAALARFVETNEALVGLLTSILVIDNGSGADAPADQITLFYYPYGPCDNAAVQSSLGSTDVASGNTGLPPLAMAARIAHGLYAAAAISAANARCRSCVVSVVARTR